jgi:hypothetical protein
VKAKAREVDSLENWRRTLTDQRTLFDLGVPLGITPAVLRPGLLDFGIPSLAAVGTPCLIGRPPPKGLVHAS